MNGTGLDSLPSASGSSGNGAFSRKRMRAVVRRRQLLRLRHQRLAEAVARGPAPDAGHAVPRQHRRAVMEARPSRSRMVHGPAVIGDLVALRHLRLHLERRVRGVQRVEHHVAVVAHHVAGGPDRVERGQVGCGTKRSVRPCPAPGTGGPARRRPGAQGRPGQRAGDAVSWASSASAARTGRRRGARTARCASCTAGQRSRR